MFWMRLRAAFFQLFYSSSDDLDYSWQGHPAVVLVAVSVTYLQNSIDLGSNISLHLEIELLYSNILLLNIQFSWEEAFRW